jgi:hypothetical protein
MVAQIWLDSAILDGEVPPIDKAVMEVHTASHADQPAAGRVKDIAEVGNKQTGHPINASQKRKQVYSDLNDLYLDECFVLPIALQPVYIVARTNLQNVKCRVQQAQMFSEVSLE